MNNLFFGILTISVCAAGYFYSWRFQARSEYKYAILFLVICGLLLRIYTSADFFLHTWDERFHALVSKNLIQHPLKPTLYDNPVLSYDYRNWTANNVWLHKQPLPLWIMAFSMWLFGTNEFALRLPSILFTTIGIGLTFSIASYFFNKKTGYLAAFLFSINGLIIELTGGRVATDHIDTCFLFFIELAVFFTILFVENKKLIFNIFAGLCVGAAILTKWMPALIVIPIWLFIVLDSKSFKLKTIIFQLIVLCLTCIIVFLPWQLYIFAMFPKEAAWEATLNFKHLTEVIEDRTGPFYYFIDRVRINYGELIYLSLIWFSWKTFRTLNNKKLLAVFIWFFVPLLFFSIAKTKMQAYILFTSPALFMITAEFWHFLRQYKTKHKFKWLYSLVLFLLIALPVRYTIERVKPFAKSDRTPQWVADLKNLDEKKIHNGVLFNYSRPVEAMFYTNLTAYPVMPEKKVIDDLVAKGYNVIINDNRNIPADVKTISGVMIECLTDGK